MDIVMDKTLEWLEFEKSWNRFLGNIHEMNVLEARHNLDNHIEVASSQEAYKRMEEHELLYTQGIAESEKWFNFVESLARTCKNCKYCLVHKGMFSNFRICNNSESKYGGDFIHKYWTCDSFERKGETDGNSIMDNSSVYGN